MCQVDLSTSNLRNYTCGQVEQPTWTMQREDPYIFTVVYTSDRPIARFLKQSVAIWIIIIMIICRQTIVTFYEKPSKNEAKLEYVSQDPRYTYVSDE